MTNHSPNCQCYDCTSGDNHIAHVRNQFGKNAAMSYGNSYSGGSQYGFNQYESNHFNELTTAPVKTTTLNPINTTQPVAQTKANLKQILGDALGSVVGNLIQAKKDGEILPPILDKVAGLGIKTEQAALNATQNKAQNEIGKQVLTFSPYIIAGLVGVVILVVVLLARK